MPHSVKCFRNVAKDDSYFFARIKSLTKGIVKISKLINRRVTSCESRLKGSYDIIITKMVKQVLKNKTFESLINIAKQRDWSVVSNI